MIDLLNKYNLPVPRYTSYPTVPYWTDNFELPKWKTVFAEEFSKHNKVEGLSIYIHLPFCESLCTYCGCNKKITTNHSVEEEYMQAMMKEWQLYVALMNEKPIIRELHLGGGTPTFFSPENLKTLVDAVLKDAIVHDEHEFSFEGHPNNTTREHLQALYDIGFRRVSFGVQDNDPEVQRVINRIQPFENVKRGTEMAREIGYKSVNFDLIYGLPLQTKEKMENTIRQAITLRPDRVAFYSYAHVPWTSRGQRLFDENDLPGASQKMELYILGKKLFMESGYVDIGMDHFSLPEDDLFKVWEAGKLHRNFMGYTTQRTGMMLGLGVSSISDAGVAFAQNHKTVHDYYESINKGELAVTKGYFLSEEDVLFRRYILDMSCNGKTTFKEAFKDRLQQYTFPELALVHADGLVNYDENHAELTPLGRHFLRNVCRAFDLHLLLNRDNKEASMPKFSKAI